MSFAVIDPADPVWSPKARKRFRGMTPKQKAEEDLRNYAFERDLNMEIESELLTAVENEPRTRRYARFLTGIKEEHKRRVIRLDDIYEGDDPEEEDC